MRGWGKDSLSRRDATSWRCPALHAEFMSITRGQGELPPTAWEPKGPRLSLTPRERNGSGLVFVVGRGVGGEVYRHSTMRDQKWIADRESFAPAFAFLAVFPSPVSPLPGTFRL